VNIIESNLKWNGNLTYGNLPVMIVLHHAEASTCTIEDIHKWHLSNGWTGCGYHYFVRKDGKIYRGRPEGAVGAHCPGVNDKSIGICAEGSYMSETMPDLQKNTILELCKDIINRYGIKQIYGHKELYNTNCPGTNYPLDDIKNLRSASIVDNGKNYIITNYLPETEYGIEIVSIIQKYFPEAQRLYLKNNSKGIWIETQYFDRTTAEKVANRLKADNLFWDLIVD
jgi:N-acetylmuramoyl-L-alanine amidase